MSVARGGPTGSEALFPAPEAASGPLDTTTADMLAEEVSLETIPYEAIVARYSRTALGIKRAIDVTLAAVGLVVAAPLLLLLAGLIWLDTRGPILFRQPRVGRRESPFMIVKLRTMDPDGRVTRVGRFLRPMGLDEIPQLWNVLKGDMSIIGPRPELLLLPPPRRAEAWRRRTRGPKSSTDRATRGRVPPGGVRCPA